MQLTTQQVNEFKELYQNEFGEELSDEEARKQARNLVQLVASVYQPIRKQELIELIGEELDNNQLT